MDGSINWELLFVSSARDEGAQLPITPASRWCRVWWSRSAVADGDDGWDTLALAHANGYTNTTSALPRWTLKPLSFTNAGSLEWISSGIGSVSGQAARAGAAALDRSQPLRIKHTAVITYWLARIPVFVCFFSSASLKEQTIGLKERTD